MLRQYNAYFQMSKSFTNYKETERLYGRDILEIKEKFIAKNLSIFQRRCILRPYNLLTYSEHDVFLKSLQA